MCKMRIDMSYESYEPVSDHGAPSHDISHISTCAKAIVPRLSRRPCDPHAVDFMDADQGLSPPGAHGQPIWEILGNLGWQAWWMEG